MGTQAGAFIDSFQRWKSMPERKDTEAFKRASKFEKNLHAFIQSKLKL
jgi:hypothetical protein